MNDFSINHNNIIESQNSHSINKLMSYHILTKGGYVSVGDCLRSITNENLQEAIDHLDKIDTEGDWDSNPYMSNILLLSLQLAQAEGQDINDDEVHKITNQTIVFLTLESLFRKGLIDLDRKNISFADGAQNRPVANIKK